MAGDGDRVTVLVATDGSESAVEAARRAAGLFVGAEFVVLSVAHEPGAAALAHPKMVLDAPIVTGGDGALRRALVDDARHAVERTAAALTSRPSRVVIEAGEPGEEICRAAADHDADVVVVGSRGLGNVRRALFGSVSDHVVRFAPCPVLVGGASRQQS